MINTRKLILLDKLMVLMVQRVLYVSNIFELWIIQVVQEIEILGWSSVAFVFINN